MGEILENFLFALKKIGSAEEKNWYFFLTTEKSNDVGKTARCYWMSLSQFIRKMNTVAPVAATWM